MFEGREGALDPFPHNCEQTPALRPGSPREPRMKLKLFVFISLLFGFFLDSLGLKTLHASEALSSSQSESSFFDEKPEPRPNVGVELRTTFSAFGGRALVPEQGTRNTNGFGLVIEYQPKFLQFLGVIGVGPTGSLYPIFNANITSTLFSLHSYGAVARYQARFFRNQFLVPVVGYTGEVFNYSFIAGQSGKVWIKGPLYGLWLLLNPLEPSAASNLYIDYGISRTYLIVEAQNLVGSDENVSIQGFTYYLGLRIEL